MPSSTWPNRSFTHSGTSRGRVVNKPTTEWALHHDQPTIFVSPYIEEGTVIRTEGDAPFDHTSIIKTLCERWDLEGLTERDRAAPSFAPVLTRATDQPRLETPKLEARPYKCLPEPKAHQGPISHLGSQIIELSAAIAGEAVPVLKNAAEAVHHLLGHLHRPGR